MARCEDNPIRIPVSWLRELPIGWWWWASGFQGNAGGEGTCDGNHPIIGSLHNRNTVVKNLAKYKKTQKVTLALVTRQRTPVNKESFLHSLSLSRSPAPVE